MNMLNNPFFKVGKKKKKKKKKKWLLIFHFAIIFCSIVLNKFFIFKTSINRWNTKYLYK